MGIRNFWKSLVGALKWLRVRDGLQPFINQWLPVVITRLAELRTLNSNKQFHEWYDQAVGEVRGIVGGVADNWIVLIISIAFEHLKASSPKSVG